MAATTTKETAGKVPVISFKAASLKAIKEMILLIREAQNLKK